jgi:hypothetical protein
MPCKIYIPAQDLWDESRGEFISIREHKLTLEHSLVSLTKYESNWHTPFLSPEEKTQEQVMDYIRCMVMGDDYDDNFIYALTPQDLKKIESYIATDQTASTIPEEKNSKEPKSNELMTSELIYYYLGQIQCLTPTIENWHLSRTLTLIRVASWKQKPEKELNKKEALAQCEDIREANMRKFEEWKRKQQATMKR